MEDLQRSWGSKNPVKPNQPMETDTEKRRGSSRTLGCSDMKSLADVIGIFQREFYPYLDKFAFHQEVASLLRVGQGWSPDCAIYVSL